MTNTSGEERWAGAQHQPVRDPGSTLSARIADQLQEQILSGELAPQTRLPAESELAASLGVSRTAVRDAMRTLSTRGLVTVRHGHGIAVAEPSDAVFVEAMLLLLLRSDLTVGDLIEARAQIEIEICSVAAERCTDEEIEELAAALDNFKTSVEQRRWRDAAVHHANVHLALLAATRYPALQILLRPMQQVILLSSHTPRRDAPDLWEVEAHMKILDAVCSRDRVHLREALIAHYQVMRPEDYREQRIGLVRDSPPMYELLAQLLHGGLPQPSATGGND